jgi:hypothetical protein
MQTWVETGQSEAASRQEQRGELASSARENWNRYDGYFAVGSSATFSFFGSNMISLRDGFVAVLMSFCYVNEYMRCERC